mmetsp:Transcript_34485/g.93462  ORF Transcript_34485/g.93462 Transcript_34485/m.93462 type:complete len:311 (-) Transcript_34485:22-954(-)
MPRRCSAASAVVALALLASQASGSGKSCNGRFECSGFDFSFGNGSLGLSHTPLMGGSPVCTYGHIEAGGACATPCSGLRRATCRCKTKAEAEDAVAGEAQSNLYISIGVLVMGVGLLGLRLKLRMSRIMAGRRHLERERMTEEDPPPQMAEPAVVQATVVGVSDPSQPAQGAVVIAEPLQKSPSQLEIVANRNPGKSSLLTAAFVVLVPGIAIGYWVVQLMRSGHGVFHDFGVFIGFVGMICYVGYFTVHVALAMNRGIPAFIEDVKRNPLRFFMAVQTRLCLFLPLIGGAGVVWAVGRMNDPAGVYSTC